MTEKLIPSAKIVDGILILSLPDALRPVVWQMELSQSRTSALEVREHEDGTYHLTLKPPRQDVLRWPPTPPKTKQLGHYKPLQLPWKKHMVNCAPIPMRG